MSDHPGRTTNIFRNHSDMGVIYALDKWARDQREREAWQDGDEGTYLYRASLLEEASRRLSERTTHQPQEDDDA